MTRGGPEVTDVVVEEFDENELLALVAVVETASEHPLAAAIVQYAAQRGVTSGTLSDFHTVPGQGASADVQGREVTVGNRKLMMEWESTSGH